MPATSQFYNHWNKSMEIFKKYQYKFGLTNKEISLIINLIFYHDINIDRMTENEIIGMLDKFGISNMKLLFSLKRADLLAQAPEFYNLLVNINNQEDNLTKAKK